MTPWTVARQDYWILPWDFPGKNTRVGSHSLLQGIFLTQGSNPDLLHCRQILYCLRHQKGTLIQMWLWTQGKVIPCTWEKIKTEGHWAKETDVATPRPRSSSCAGAGGPRGSTSHSRSGGAAVRRYPSSKVRSRGCALLEQPQRATPRPR